MIEIKQILDYESTTYKTPIIGKLGASCINVKAECYLIVGLCGAHFEPLTMIFLLLLINLLNS